MNGEKLLQIKKELDKTLACSSIIKTEKIRLKIKNVLRAISIYEPAINNYQGMSFVVDFFLYHCEEHVAFWLIVELFEEYNYKTIFVNNYSVIKYHVCRHSLM